MEFQEFTIRMDRNMHFHLKAWLPGIPAKALIFVIHGLSDHGGRFVYLAERMVAEGFACIVPDLRGNGRSGGKRGHFASASQIISDLDFLLNECRNRFPGLQVILYGQSMGGNLALYYGGQRQQEIKGIISSSPWIQLTSPPNAMITAIGSMVARISPSLLIPNGINPFDLCHDREICQRYANDPLIHGKISLKTFTIIQGSGNWILSHASGFQIPVLLMHGSGDKITSFEASSQFASKNLSYCTFKSWDGLYHELHNEVQKNEILDTVVEWLKILLPGYSNQFSADEKKSIQDQ